MPAHAKKSRGVRDLARAGLRAGRGWRRSRPFWGALITMVGGAEIVAVRLSLPVHHPRTVIPAGVLIAGAIIACGLLLLFDPVQRSVYATAAILLAISALMTSHLGGYLLGTLLGGAGGAIAFAWVPGREPATAELTTTTGPQGFTLILGEADGLPDRPSRPDRDLCAAERLQPALPLRHLDRLGPVTGAQLLHGRRQVIAYRPGRQMQAIRDLDDGIMPSGGGQHIRLTIGQRALAVRQRGRR